MKFLLNLLIILFSTTFCFAQSTVKEVYEKLSNNDSKLEYTVMVEDEEKGCFSITSKLMDNGCAAKLTYTISKMSLKEKEIYFELVMNDDAKSKYTAHYTIGDKYHELLLVDSKGKKNGTKLKPKGSK